MTPLLKRHTCTVGKDLRGHVSNGQAVNQAFIHPQVNEHAQLLCLEEAEEEAEQEVAEEEEVRAQGGEPTPGSWPGSIFKKNPPNRRCQGQLVASQGCLLHLQGRRVDCRGAFHFPGRCPRRLARGIVR